MMMMGNSEGKGPVAGRFDPFVLLKDIEVRKKVQGAFKSTTREAWQSAHSSKTMPPEVGKYKPKFSQIESDKKVAKIRNIKPNVGEQHIAARDEQHTHVCLKVVKGLNYPVFHEKSQARRLAKVNKKLMEMEIIAKMDPFHVETEQEEPTQSDNKKDEKLDMLNFYVKEMREPIY